MPSPKRRSARLAGRTTSPLSPGRAFAAFAVNKLTSLLEREDTPNEHRSMKAIVSSPMRARDKMPGGFDSDDSFLKTPQTVPPIRPAREEMHPSKAQRSTTEEPDSALRLGFADIKDNEHSTIRALEDTPSKSTAELQNPDFEFKWARQESDLSSEAQRIMDSVREEAARIKEKMQSERDEQAQKDREAGLVSPITGRRIATPRRMAGRFSDAHKTEFSKMDSIANHVSLLRDKVKTTGQTLKRTKSRAELGDDSTIPEHPENPRAGKRIRTNAQGGVFTAADAPKASFAGGVTRSLNKLPAAITTPTKSSIARSASVKSIRTTSKLPSLLRSKSSKALASPVPRAAPKSEGSNRYFSALARVPSMKSILHRPQPKYSDDPVKIAAGTHLPLEVKMPKELQYPRIGQSPVKRVGFNLGNGIKSPTEEPSSPSKIPTGAQIQYTPTKIGGGVSYPQLSPSRPGPLSSHPPAAGDFTFRSPNGSIKFRSAPNTPASTRPTVRRVRPSGISTPLAPFENMPTMPHGMPNKKRRRPDEEDDDVENNQPQNSTAKRAKITTTPKPDLKHMDAVEKRKNASVSPKKKPMLSLSRLNALARPKSRG